jgi:FkbM family methyltransferase
MRVSGDRISLTRGRREIVLGVRDMILVPFSIHSWKEHFETFEGVERDGRLVLDFSEPAIHRYRKSGLAFHFPSFAEDDCMDAYTASYRPREGDVVWDVGAHAGMTAYMLAQMVGPTGMVYAFEPDEMSYDFLLRNIEMHEIGNVVPVKAALSGKTGKASFQMDGTMRAGLSDSLSFTARENRKVVETLRLEDACEQLGSVPTFIKMDIEGGELSVVAGALEFLRDHPIHFSIESNHTVDGRFTSGPLEVLLRRAGYRAWSSEEYGQLFTWAEPPKSATRERGDESVAA